MFERTLESEVRSLSVEDSSIRGVTNHITPWKINMEHNNGGLEDHFPLNMGDL